MKLGRRNVLFRFGSTIGLATLTPEEALLFGRPSDYDLREVRPPTALGTGNALAVSVDGSRLILSGGDTVQRFQVWPSGAVNAYGRSRGVFRTLAVDSWTQLWASSLSARPYRGSCFIDGNRSLVLAGDSWYVLDSSGDVVNSHPLSRVEGSPTQSGRLVEIDAYKGSLAIGGIARGSTGIDWIQIDISDGRELKRASAPKSPPTDRRARTPPTPLIFSTNREVFACGVQNQIELRRASDLSLVFSAEGNPDLTVGRVGVSHTGSLLAAAFGAGRQKPNGMYGLAGVETIVYDVNSGKVIQQFPVDGYEGVAISPDDKYLATAAVIHSERFRESVEIRIRVYAIATGKLVGTGLHVRVRDERGGYLNAGLATRGLFFIPGRQLLVSTGSIVKVWAVG